MSRFGVIIFAPTLIYILIQLLNVFLFFFQHNTTHYMNKNRDPSN